MNSKRCIAGDRRSQPAALLVIALLFLRCLIVPGWMPDPAAASQGEFKLVICTEHGAKTISVPLDDAPAPGAPEHDQGRCAFAACGAFGDSPVAVECPAIAFRAAAADGWVETTVDTPSAQPPRPRSAGRFLTPAS